MYKKKIKPYFAHIRIEDDNGNITSFQSGLIIAKTEGTNGKPLLDDLLVLTCVNPDKKSIKMSIAFDHRTHGYSQAYLKYCNQGILTISIDGTKKEYKGLNHSLPPSSTSLEAEDDDYIIWKELKGSISVEKIKVSKNRRLKFKSSNIDKTSERSQGFSEYCPAKTENDQNNSLEKQIMSASIFKATGGFVGLVTKVFPELENIVRFIYEPLQNIDVIINSTNANQ